MVAPKKNGKVIGRRGAPARSLESRENQMVSLAVDLAEKQLREGSASAQVITHYLKLGTTVQQLEKKKLEQDVELVRAKTEAIKSAKKVEELYKDALNAMRTYSGRPKDGDNDDEDN